MAAIAGWVEKTQLKLPPLEEEFLRKSLEKRDREIKAELEQERQLREAAEARAIAQAEKAKAEKQRTQLAIGSGVVGVVLVTFFGLIQIQFAKISEANTLIASAETFKRNNYQLEALMESVKALNVLQQVYLDKIDLLKRIKNIIYEVQERNRLTGHTSEVLGLSFHPNGKMIASSGFDKTIKLWSTE